MSKKKSSDRSLRAQRIVAIIVLVSMVLGAGTFFAAVSSTTPTPQPTATIGH